MVFRRRGFENLTQILKLAVGVLSDDRGRMLVVRKRGTAVFMQPGGKIDAGERAPEALCRELHEELGLSVDVAELRPLGQARAIAANEPDTMVEAEIFRLRRAHWPDFAPGAEIEETCWATPDDGLPLAPLTKDEIWPRLMAQAGGGSYYE